MPILRKKGFHTFTLRGKERVLSDSTITNTYLYILWRREEEEEESEMSNKKIKIDNKISIYLSIAKKVNKILYFFPFLNKTNK